MAAIRELAVETIIDRLCGLAVNSFDLHQFFDTGGLYALQTAKGVQ